MSKSIPHYANQPTAALQERREVLLRIPRLHTAEERAEMQALEAELQARNVLSIGIDF